MLVYIYIFNTSKIETTREYLFFGFIFLSSSFFFTELNMFSLSFNPLSLLGSLIPANNYPRMLTLSGIALPSSPIRCSATGQTIQYQSL